MSRPLRIEFAGALYHVMARGDGGKAVFEERDDALSFLKLLSKSCARCGWRVHAWVLLSNHFHVLLETPEPNLVIGMKGLLGEFSQSWNRRRRRRGHVFQGRYKAVVVNGDEGDGEFFQVVADYIHLNPVRAGLVGGTSKKELLSYEWSSLPHYRRNQCPEWLERQRVLDAFALSGSRRGRLAYVKSLEERAKNREALKTESSELMLYRGWYMGNEAFRDQLVDKAKALVGRVAKGSVTGEAVRLHERKEAEVKLMRGMGFLELPKEREALKALGCGQEDKVLLASWLKQNTTVGNGWISNQLVMGNERGLARMVRRVLDSKSGRKKYEKLNQMLQCAD
ncbi:hypothetical protein FEM03_03950 [Phragmitibacter flavus]|uniref:Transposase IS200-like domain-containing protein n=1 Tax=Phragmitibacter flavus TaxID=2576071 RepID=A0A5R8KHU9_9BACT|nr:transposase [Phragmitibacter flavus]TLD71888.1 hypothetical protein FEM03_03950 [Phragmitibacter flavus]